MLLFDQNLSYKLVKRLEDTFIGLSHVKFCGMTDSSDIEIWEYAKKNGFCIVTQDIDFVELSLVKESPPKVILLKVGNTSTSVIENLLRSKKKLIYSFIKSSEESALQLS